MSSFVLKLQMYPIIKLPQLMCIASMDQLLCVMVAYMQRARTCRQAKTHSPAQVKHEHAKIEIDVVLGGVRSCGVSLGVLTLDVGFVDHSN